MMIDAPKRKKKVKPRERKKTEERDEFFGEREEKVKENWYHSLL